MIVRGSFVRAAAHPEYGVGRVIAVDDFATRVLFVSGGVRVYKNSDPDHISTASPQPSDEERSLLEEKETRLGQGGGGAPHNLARAATAAAASMPKPKKAKAARRNSAPS